MADVKDTKRARADRFATLLPGAHDQDPTRPGCRVYTVGGDEFGISLGVCGRYRGEAGPSDRVAVLWADGEQTKCNARGILFRRDRWQIAG